MGLIARKIKAILFDLVGTLIYVKDSVGEVYSNLASGYGLIVAPSTLESSFQVTIDKFGQFVGRKEEEKNWWKKVVYETFKLSGVDLDIDIKCMELVHKKKSNNLFDNLFEDIYKEFTRKTAWAIYPDVLPVFDKLKKKKIKIGLISNFDNRLEIILKGLDIHKYFNSLSYSGKVGFSKPDPRIFQYALNELNVLPEESIYIGDSLEGDYYPACELGINAYLIDRGKKSMEKGIKKINSLDEIFVLDVIARGLK